MYSCARTNLPSRNSQTTTAGTSKGRPLLLSPWWDGPITQSAVGEQLAAAAVDRPQRWFWLYHAPPTGTLLCRDGRREFPDHQLASWIAEYGPDVVLAGHIHQAPWVDGGSWHDRLGDTLVFNPDARSARFRRT